MKKNELLHTDYKKIKHGFNKNNILIPLITSSLVIVLLIFILHEVNFDIREISGASAIVFTSFASSVFLMFLMPYSKSAKRNRVVKSYLIAGVFGYIGFFATRFINFYLVVGIIMFAVSFLLFETDSEHPPAIGIAVAFLLFKIPIYGIITLIIGVFIVVALKTLMQKLGILSKASEFTVK